MPRCVCAACVAVQRGRRGALLAADRVGASRFRARRGARARHRAVEAPHPAQRLSRRRPRRTRRADDEGDELSRRCAAAGAPAQRGSHRGPRCTWGARSRGGGATSAASTAARTPRATRASTGETAARAPRATRSSGGGCRCARVPRAPALLPRRGATPGAAFPIRRRRGLQTRKLLGLRSGQEGGARTCGGLAERSRGLAGTGGVTSRSRPARVRLFPPRSATGRPTLQLLYTFCASRSSAHQRRALGALGRSCDPRYVVSLVIHAGGCSCPLPGMPEHPAVAPRRPTACSSSATRPRAQAHSWAQTRDRASCEARGAGGAGEAWHGGGGAARHRRVASSPARRQERILFV